MATWRDNARQISPYIPGEQPKGEGIIKINTNENPYPPAPGVERVLKELNSDPLRRYPDPEISLLRETLAVCYGFEKEQIFVGVGSDDVLAVAFMSFFNSEKPILFPDITYSFYPVWSELFRVPYKTLALDEDFRIKKEDYFQKNGGIILANPNAPTGICEGREFIRDIVKNNSESIVIVDEAYVDFGGESALDLVHEFDNVLVVQTFSKSRSMAGVRIGFAVGNSKLIDVMNNVKFSYNSYTINSLSVLMGVESLKDDIYFKKTCKKIVETREQTKESLRNLGFDILDSKANFLFVTHPKYQAKEILLFLRNKKIYVRHFSEERINNYLRITIGTDEEMKQLLLALKEFVK